MWLVGVGGIYGVATGCGCKDCRGGSRTFLMVGLNAPAYRARENNYVLETTLTN